MRTNRMYVDTPLSGVDELALPPAATRHAIRVLRLRVGAPLTLFNGDGYDYAGTLAHAAGAAARVRLHDQTAPDNESPWPLTLAQCLARGDKMDLVMQKATELGVTRIVPLVSERSGVRLDAARGARRLAHWQAVVASACEQCGRARLPQVAAPHALQSWLTALPADRALRLALLPGAHRRVRDLTPPTAGVLLVVGPEGGFAERDTTALTAAGFAGLALGPRILRTETAGLAALAAIQACHGDG